MTKTITIQPVTRIEGHARVAIQLDEAGEVADAKFHVMALRGFEKFVEGRPVEEMHQDLVTFSGSIHSFDRLCAAALPQFDLVEQH